MSRSIITLTTDFGLGSPYVAQMKGVILSINPAATVVDVTHAVPPQDVRQGALVLGDVTPRFPAGSIHIAVIDPGVGTERQIIGAEIAGHFYVAPDNGLLARLAADDPGRRQVALTNREYHLPEISATFHGRDIMAPVAAHLSLGTCLDDLGPPVQTLVPLPWPEVAADGNQISGSILTKDVFGNLITNIDASHVARLGRLDALTVHCGGRTIRGLVRTYGQRPAGSLVALFGSSGRLEIAVVNGNAATHLDAKTGDSVAVTLGAVGKPPE
jgi:S-adenosylmethionine hydrolase